MRRFRVSNFQSKTSVKPFCTAMPMGMSPGWNQIQFNLADFTRRAYGSNYLETVSVQVHANVRIRRIYFTDKLYAESELPYEYMLLGRPKDPKKEKTFKAPPSGRPPSPLTTAREPKPVEATEASTAPETEADVEMSAPATDAAETPAAAAAEEASEAPTADAPAEEAPPPAEATEEAYY